MSQIKWKFIALPILGIVSSLIPAIVILPLESVFGEGDHLSLGDLLALTLPIVAGFYGLAALVVASIKHYKYTSLALIILVFAQAMLSMLEFGYIG